MLHSHLIFNKKKGVSNSLFFIEPSITTLEFNFYFFVASSLKAFHAFSYSLVSGIIPIFIALFYFNNFLSAEKLPAPNTIKKISSIVIAKSVRYSCAICQKPLFRRIGIFVVINAVIIIISNGIEANLVRNPISTKEPQTISNVATNKAQNSGFSKPIFFDEEVWHYEAIKKNLYCKGKVELIDFNNEIFRKIEKKIVLRNLYDLGTLLNPNG